MSKKTEKFEIDCTQTLNSTYGHLASFTHMGKSDSTVSDICAVSANGIFYIEVKESSSQCCQFVLFPNQKTRSFDFSPGNKYPKNQVHSLIISYMNKRYDVFCKVNKAGIPIEIDKSILYLLVNEFHAYKNVEFFMTKKNGYIIFLLEKFPDYFDITACYRNKASGSTEPNQNKNDNEILQALNHESITGTIEYRAINGKMRCFFHSPYNLHERRMYCENYTYQFKSNEHSAQVLKRSPNVYEIRRLSNTSNPNVICQITLKQSKQIPIDLKRFECKLR